MRREPMPMACQIPVGSSTQAIRIRRTLSAAGIACAVTKQEHPDLRRGCSYAVAYDCLQARHAEEILRNAGIRVRK